jgi:proton-dependent oligopeptide transporter, POT family
MSDARARFPSQIKYIIGNEAAERYSYYGMVSILTLFMTDHLLFSDAEAESTYHLFAFCAYLTPLLGGWIADRFWGKYRTIITLSSLYVAGHAVLALYEDRAGLYVGLALIALGAGGIKPCVAAHVGDQFTRVNKHLLPRVFDLFYFSINLGSLFATILTPLTRRLFGPQVAFGIPGVLMALALLIFWLGRRHYIAVPPTGRRADTPGKVLLCALRRGVDEARRRFGEVATGEALVVLRIAMVLLPVTMFWALFFQTGSSWVLLTREMNLHGFLEPDMLQAANPALVLLFIPIFARGIYPAFERRGHRVTPLGRMQVGMFVTAGSFVAVAALRALLDDGVVLSAFWLFLPYAILTAGEILVSITGLEFAYTQAPRSVKSTVMSVWYLTIASGNLLKATVAQLNVFDEGPAQFLFWSAAMVAVAVVFVFVARRYRMVDHTEDGAS